MTLRATGDREELERRADENPAAMKALVDSALSHGLISHRFYGTASGEIMVLDEWETEEGFNVFFAANPQIQDLMAQVGVSKPPEVTFWRRLETHDAV